MRPTNWRTSAHCRGTFSPYRSTSWRRKRFELMGVKSFTIQKRQLHLKNDRRRGLPIEAAALNNRKKSTPFDSQSDSQGMPSSLLFISHNVLYALWVKAGNRGLPDDAEAADPADRRDGSQSSRCFAAEPDQSINR
jgi:hypothetical protein